MGRTARWWWIISSMRGAAPTRSTPAAAAWRTMLLNGKEFIASGGAIALNEGTWHHVAVVYDGSRPATNDLTRHVHFYVDGVQRGAGLTNSLPNVTVLANTNALTIGNASAS